MPGQYRTMRLVAERANLPVPRVLWPEEGPETLGAPFFVMERVEGLVPPDVMPQGPCTAHLDTLILHHGSQRAMVQGSYWEEAG